MYRLLLLALGFSINYQLCGESTGSKGGALKDTEFIIEKERKNQLPEADRLYKSAPSVVLDEAPEPLAPSAPPSVNTGLTPLAPKIKLLRAKEDLLVQLYHNYSRGGYGNFYTPHLEFFLNAAPHPDYSYGAYIQHQSSGKSFLGEVGKHIVDLYGTRFIDALSMGVEGRFLYQGDRYTFYPSALETRLTHQLSMRGTCKSYREGPLHYQVAGALQGLVVADSSEGQAEMQATGAYTLSEALKLEAAGGIMLRTSDEAQNACYQFRFTPMGSVYGAKWQGGAKVALYKAASRHSLSIYPILKGKYPIYTGISLYGGLDGALQLNTLQDFLQKSPWLALEKPLKPTESWVLEGGAEGNIVQQVSFRAGGSLGAYKNLAFFRQKEQEKEERFAVQYDPNAWTLRIFGELGQATQDERWSARLRGAYQRHWLQELAAPWYCPRYQVDCRATYNWHNKVLLKGELAWLGGVEGPKKNASELLPDVVDLNVDLDYCWSSRFSTFFWAKHLLNQHPKQYLHHPLVGRRFLIGGAYAW